MTKTKTRARIRISPEQAKLRLLVCLYDTSRSAQTLAKLTGLSEATVRRHLRKLEHEGLIFADYKVSGHHRQTWQTTAEGERYVREHLPASRQNLKRLLFGLRRVVEVARCEEGFPRYVWNVMPGGSAELLAWIDRFMDEES